MNPEDYALVIGINDYPGLSPLKAAERDALRFVDWLQDPLGGGLLEDHITCIISGDYTASDDPFDAQPIKHDIDRALKNLGVAGKTRIGRRLYFYFAGHGLGIKFDEIALLMANAAPNMFGMNIGMGAYRRYFRHVAPFDELVVFLDCCREYEDRASPGAPVFKLTKRENAPDVQDFLAFATRHGKRAYEPEVDPGGENRGLFTDALLEGLSGKAADPSTKQVTAASLRAYLARRLPELAKERDRKQKPEFEGNATGIVFGDVSPDWPRITLVVPAGWDGEVAIQDGYRQEKERRPANAGPWEINLPAGLYYLLHVDSGQRRFFEVLEGKKEPIHVTPI